jgi:cytosine/adenosine deaminase-related metal-dependent hydrolase
MPFITAKQIHNGHGWLPEGSVIEVAEDGTIVSVLSEPVADTIFYEGILAPGFVNAHCHLELSHMRGAIPEHTTLIPFLKNVSFRRGDFTDEQKHLARHAAYTELVKNGVVAVGDIANTTDTIDLRSRGQLHLLTFVEALGFTESNAPRAFDAAVRTFNAFAQATDRTRILGQAVVPHAPYSVSSSLFRLIDAHSENTVISIHNQESEEEDKYYLSKEGNVRDLLHSLGIDDSLFTPTGRSSLQSYLNWLSAGRSMIFVHNTYTSREDIQYAQNRLGQAHWCLCPNANLYIENTLPDIDLLISEQAQICIGTDSLASNHELSIISELNTIKEHYPAIDWGTLLTWATKNGAKALQMEHAIGSIETGKQPGIVQVTFPGSEKPTVNRLF